MTEFLRMTFVFMIVVNAILLGSTVGEHLFS